MGERGAPPTGKALHLVEEREMRRPPQPRTDRGVPIWNGRPSVPWGNFCSRGNRHFLLFSRRSPAVRPRPALSKTRTRRIGRSTSFESERGVIRIDRGRREGIRSERIVRVQERWSSRSILELLVQNEHQDWWWWDFMGIAMFEDVWRCLCLDFFFLNKGNMDPWMWIWLYCIITFEELRKSLFIISIYSFLLIVFVKNFVRFPFNEENVYLKVWIVFY